MGASCRWVPPSLMCGPVESPLAQRPRQQVHWKEIVVHALSWEASGSQADVLLVTTETDICTFAISGLKRIGSWSRASWMVPRQHVDAVMVIGRMVPQRRVMGCIPC